MKSSTYNAEIDNIGRNEWSELLPLFSDGSLNQTWPSGGITGEDKNLSHLILKGGEGVAAMAQVSIKKLRGIKAGVALLIGAQCGEEKVGPQITLFWIR